MIDPSEQQTAVSGVRPQVELSGTGGDAARERQRAMKRQEVVADALRLRSEAIWAALLWPAFFAVDFVQVTWIEPGTSFWWIAAWRLSLMPVLFVAIYRLARSPSAREVWVHDVAIAGWACAILSVICLETGGLRSHYAAGLLCVIAARGMFMPRPWRSSIALHLVLIATYPATMGAGALFYDDIRWQFGDASSLGVFAFWNAVIIAICVLAIAGGHTIWALRRQVFEARNIGKYRLKEPIGVGGMGEVWAAYHSGLKRDVALKILHPDHGAKVTAVQRFEREVKATSELTHPNTVRVFDYGVTPDGLWYYAMELLEGTTLGELVRAEGPQPAERVVHIVSQAARALAEAHAKGIVHRDIKPDNLFLTSAGGEVDFVKILDFGIANVIQADGSGHITTTGSIPGTPVYMAPEVITGSHGAPPADVYGLGAVMYFLLAGKPPFDADNWAQAMIANAQLEAKPPSSIEGIEVPADLEDIVMRCLAKDPEQRYGDGAALAAALAGVAAK